MCRSSQQVAKLFHGQTGLPDDVSQCSGSELLRTMEGHRNRARRIVGVGEQVMAAAPAINDETSPLQRSQSTCRALTTGNRRVTPRR